MVDYNRVREIVKELKDLAERAEEDISEEEIEVRVINAESGFGLWKGMVLGLRSRLLAKIERLEARRCIPKQ